jgi:hypothetical protein
MDGSHFDTLTRAIAQRGSRRWLVRLVALLPLGGALTTIGEDEAGAEHPVNRVQRHTQQRNRNQRNNNNNNKNNQNTAKRNLQSGGPPCNAKKCPQGCCAGRTCAAGTDWAQCGTGGAACQACATGQVCTGSTPHCDICSGSTLGQQCGQILSNVCTCFQRVGGSASVCGLGTICNEGMKICSTDADCANQNFFGAACVQASCIGGTACAPPCA